MDRITGAEAYRAARDSLVQHRDDLLAAQFCWPDDGGFEKFAKELAPNLARDRRRGRRGVAADTIFAHAHRNLAP
jgi:hypothetical protein